MLLQELLGYLPKKKIVGEIDGIEVKGVSSDSRTVKRGEVFVALSGGEYDGEDFIEEAIFRGASAIVCEHAGGQDVPYICTEDVRSALSYLAAAFYGNPQRRLKIIGVTGTNGKTTTCHFLASVLKNAGKNTGIIGTVGIFYAGKCLSSRLTTPDPVQLFALLADMAEEGVEYAVMEVSAHAVFYRKTAPIDFTACIFTNCTQDHLDFFKDMETYARVKESLFAEGHCEIAVLNFDDELGIKIARKCQVYHSYGLNTPADHFALIRSESICGSEVVFNLQDEILSVDLQLPGEHNVMNALAAATCARALGISVEAISEGLSLLSCVPGRLQRVDGVNGGNVFLDYAHTPDALHKALFTLKKQTKGKLLCVFGCGGNRDESKRPLMGEVAGRLADFCVLTSDNPRYEEPYTIIAAIESGYRRASGNYVVVQDRKKAIEYAMRRLGGEDTLLIAGKGGENYQEIMGIRYDYSDEEVVRDAAKRIRTE